MNYKELKEFCNEKIKEYPEYLKKYKKEIIVAKRFYNNNRNLVEELKEKKNEIDKRYIIPFLLGLTNEVINKDFEYIQVKTGMNSAIDVDMDFSRTAKEKVKEYLINKYGEEKVLSVGTFSRLGIASAIKDLMRVYKLGDFKTMNAFTKPLDANLSWEENLQILKSEHHNEYRFYLNNKEVLDLVPSFLSKIRGVGKHAGGVCVLDRPVYDLIPVERVSGMLVTAFPESGAESVLDECGIIKYDILSITILDVIAEAVNLIDEKLYLIEEDGIQKVVPASYIDKEIEQF